MTAHDDEKALSEIIAIGAMKFFDCYGQEMAKEGFMRWVDRELKKEHAALTERCEKLERVIKIAKELEQGVPLNQGYFKATAVPSERLLRLKQAIEAVEGE